MPRPTQFPLAVLTLFVAALPSGLLSADDKETGVRVMAEIADLEFQIKARQLACKMADLELEKAEVDLTRAELQLETAKSAGQPHIAHLSLDQRQASIHIEMRKLETEMARVELEQAKARMSHLRKAIASTPRLQGPVQVEYVEDLDVVVVRGEGKDVAKVKTLMQELEAKTKGGQPAVDKPAAKVEALLKERRDTLGQLAGVVEESYRQGVTGHESVIRAFDSLIEAELDLATDKSKRIALHEKRVGNMKKLEDITKAMHQAAEAGQVDVLAAKAARLKAEIALARERASDK